MKQDAEAEERLVGKLYCEACEYNFFILIVLLLIKFCRKSFRSDNAFAQHNRTKKHLASVKRHEKMAKMMSMGVGESKNSEPGE